MEIHFTSRHFRAHPTIQKHALDAVKKLDRYYDGIRRCDVILSFERQMNSVKIVEINLHVNRTLLHAVEKSDDYHKSIDNSIEKISRQLAKYKAKFRGKDKKTARRTKVKNIL